MVERQEKANKDKQVIEVLQEMGVKHKQSKHIKLEKKSRVDEQITLISQERYNTQERYSQTDFRGETMVNCSSESFHIAKGHKIECTLLQSMAISKAKLTVHS